MQREVALSERHDQPLSLVMIDMDHFKQVNDVHGHAAGDHLLRTFADCVRMTLRRTDMAFRYGGDEFVILLRDTTLDGAKVRAKTICSEIATTPIQIDSIKVDITVSVGVAGYHQRAPVSKNQLINLADKAMYQSKRDGRNRVSVQEESD